VECVRTAERVILHVFITAKDTMIIRNSAPPD